MGEGELTNDGASARRSRTLRAINWLFLVVGAVALAWLVRRIGTGDVVRTIRAIGLSAVVLFAVSAASLCLNAAAIRIFMRPASRMVSYQRVLVAQLSGQALNMVTPMATVGELTKVTMLIGHVPRHRAVSSIIAFNVVNLACRGVFVVIAIGVSLLFFDFSPQLDWLLRSSMVAIVLIGVASLAVMHVGLVRSFAAISQSLGMLSSERRQRINARLGSFDNQLRLFGRRREANYTLAIVCVALGQALAIVDMWVLLEATGHPQTLSFVVVAAAAGSLIGTLASIVPLGIGANEGGIAGLFVLLGPGAVVGLGIALIMRLRAVAVAAIGLSVMLGVQLFDRRSEHARRSRAYERQAARRRSPPR